MVTEIEEIFHSRFGEKSSEIELLLTSKILLMILYYDNSPLNDGLLGILKHSDLLQG